MDMQSLATEISAFNRQLPQLRREYGHSWVVFVGEECKGGFDDFDTAAQFAVRQYSEHQFLIRHTDATEPQVPFVVVKIDAACGDSAPTPKTLRVVASNFSSAATSSKSSFIGRARNRRMQTRCHSWRPAA